MKEPKLVEFIKSGYPYVKDETGLPSWVLPEHGLNRVTDEVGDSGILEVSRPLGLTESVEHFLKEAPDPSNIPPQDWQDAIKRWQPSSHVSTVVTAYLEAIGPVMAKIQSIKPRIDLVMICRSLAVLLFAPFVDCGRALLEEIAGKLDGSPSDPAGLIKRYADAVYRADIATLDNIDRSIVKYSNWQEWMVALQKQALKCRHTPKLVAVTPPPSADMARVLATLMKEVYHGSSGDSPQHQGEPVVAQ